MRQSVENGNCIHNNMKEPSTKKKKDINIFFYLTTDNEHYVLNTYKYSLLEFECLNDSVLNLQKIISIAKKRRKLVPTS